MMLMRRCFLNVQKRSFSSDSRSVLLERGLGASKRVAVITLNDPKRLNALTASMGDELGEIISELSHDTEGLGAVVVTGAGDRAFSAGGDLDFLRDRAKDAPSRNAVVMRRFYKRFLSIRDLPVPVLAAINGHAIGAGLCFALASDIRVASETAKLGVTFTQLGLHPGMGATFFLPRLVGPQQAAKLLLTGETISAKEAKEIGMVVKTCSSSSETLEETIKLANRIASASPVAVRTCVRSIRLGMDEQLDRALWREADAQSQTYATTDLAEGVEAVAEKRKPEFTLWESLKD